MTPPLTSPRRWHVLSVELLIMGVLPIVLAVAVLHLRHWDLSVPLIYSGSDDVWQLVLTKMVRDTGWFLTSPFMGAPDIAHWNYHSAAQTSSLHSMIIWLMSFFIDDAVKIQQVYYLLNFSLISLSAYFTCRTLGLARWAAGSVGFLFAFTSFRIGWLFYAFLANYAAVPLGFLPVFWTLTGQYGALTGALRAGANIRLLLRSPKLWIGVLCIVLVTLSDGYYAFFTLLMLAFAVFVRAALGDWRRPASLFAPLMLIAVLMVVAVGMTLPLKAYQRAHPEEFAPGGKPDLTLGKRPFEAEVYSSSLKLMIAPVINHRIPAVAEFGKAIVETNDMARKFAVTKPIVSLGTICSLLLLSALAALPVLAIRNRRATTAAAPTPTAALAGAALVLAYFTFLTAISGGVGTLVALLYPTIRAYDRMPLFIAFALLVGAGALATARWGNPGRFVRWALYGAAVILTSAGLYDQIPADTRGDADAAVRFLAERKVVQQLERALPAEARMVYQYPHSQYLFNSKYYGWGSFAHIRLYLHSHNIRWSNGGSKNSPVENWHDKIAALPFERLLNEISGVGFKAMVIDRKVVPAAEFSAISAVLAARGIAITDDVASMLSVAYLPDPGYKVTYSSDFSLIDRVVVSDPARLVAERMPRLLDGAALVRAVIGGATTVERSAHPALFRSGEQVNRGLGMKAILPLSDMAGDLRCSMAAPASGDESGAAAIVRISNRSNFDWQFGTGPFPFKLGVHVRGPADSMVRWDDGYRVPTEIYVAAGASVDVRVPLAPISRTGIDAQGRDLALEFAIVQDGHAWFDPLRCRVPLPR